jgi:ketosteroid isomerase-like protein
MTPDEFIERYERALATQLWVAVEPLIHADACVTFSTGEVHAGKDAVRSAFEANFAAIKDETYAVSNVHWMLRSDAVAVYAFAFRWSGVIDGRAASGAGRGTGVLVRDGAGWKLIAEHLGPGPR